MNRAASRTLTGRYTRRGVGVTRTVGCRIQSLFNPSMNGLANLTLEVPNPPRIGMPTRDAVYIKYLEPGGPTTGRFYLVERQTTVAEARDRGYPLRGFGMSETLKQKRLKQIYLPITGRIRIYSGFTAVESGSTFEYG